MAGYGSDSAFATYLTDNGLTLPVGAPTAAVLRQRGSDYIDRAYGARFSGVPTLGYAQERAWGRTGATAYWADIPEGVIPDAVVWASYAAAYAEAVLGAATPAGSLSVTVIPGEAVKRAKAGPAEVEFFGGADALSGAIPVLSAVDGLLSPFFWVRSPAVMVV